MKPQKVIFALIFSMLVMLFNTNVYSKLLHNETVTFKVYGNCEMCKERIETALKKNSAIKIADWEVKTKIVNVVYGPHLISVEQIHQIVADAGHDTDKVKATDAAYKNIPGCCQYKRKK